MIERARLDIPPSGRFLQPALSFVSSYARQLELRSEAESRLSAALEAALNAVVRRNAEGPGTDPISLEVGEELGRLSVSLLNRGVPLQSSDAVSSSFQGTDKVSLENLGRQGQRMVLEFRIGAPGVAQAQTPSPAEDAGEMVVRDLRPGEEEALSALFFAVYGYNYINEYVYYPDKLAAMLREGKLISTVAALPDGRLIGHVGLLRWNDSPPVYEPCLGVVDPRVKSRGIFGKCFKEIMARVERTPMQYALFDYVTNHDFSQRLCSAYGTCELALLAGNQSKATQASLERLGLGQDPEDMDRYSILVAVLPRTQYPFGREITLPESIGEPLGFLLSPLNLSWYPAPRFSVLPAQGDFKVQYQPQQSSVGFDLFQPGRAALGRILDDWRGLLRNGYQYASIDVPFSARADLSFEAQGLGQIHETLSANGFFLAGFMPYHLGDKLAVRFQAIAPTKVAFDKIRVFTETGRRLLEVVRSDYERNCLL